jgi:hypothetical protein
MCEARQIVDCECYQNNAGPVKVISSGVYEIVGFSEMIEIEEYVIVKTESQDKETGKTTVHITMEREIK